MPRERTFGSLSVSECCTAAMSDGVLIRPSSWNVRPNRRLCFSVSERASRHWESSPPATNRLWCSVSAL